MFLVEKAFATSSARVIDDEDADGDGEEDADEEADDDDDDDDDEEDADADADVGEVEDDGANNNEEGDAAGAMRGNEEFEEEEEVDDNEEIDVAFSSERTGMAARSPSAWMQWFLRTSTICIRSSSALKGTFDLPASTSSTNLLSRLTTTEYQASRSVN